MKVSTDSLISALLHPSLYLIGDTAGCVSLYCKAHATPHPIAIYGRDEDDGAYRDPRVAYTTGVPALFAEAAKHLRASHSAEVAS